VQSQEHGTLRFVQRIRGERIGFWLEPPSPVLTVPLSESLSPRRSRVVLLCVLFSAVDVE